MTCGWPGWPGWPGLPLDGLDGTAETQDFFTPIKCASVLGVFACYAYRETGGRDL